MSSIPRLMELRRQVLLYSLHFVVCPRYRHFLSGLSRRLSPGTSVAVYGTIGPDSPRSSYLLDAPPASVYTAGTLQATAFQQLFFQSPTLSDGEHTLLVTNLGSGALWIDYFRYTSSVASQPAPPSASSSLTSSRIVTVTPSNESVTNSPTPDPSPSGTGPGPNPARTPIPIAAVVGGAIGALVLIIALIFGMLYYRKRARRLAGVQLLEKKDVLAGKMMIQLSPWLKLKPHTCLSDSSELDKTDPGAVITPFTNTYAPGHRSSLGHGGSPVNMYPPGSIHPPSDYGYPDQGPPTPIYNFSSHYSMGDGDGGTQYGGVQQQAYSSSDRLAAPQRRGSLESAKSSLSLAYLSGDRVAMDPSSPLPDSIPGSPSTRTNPQRTEKAGFIVHNDYTPELRQHEDGGVRLDVQQPQDSSPQQQVIDLPPVYKPSY